MSPNFFHTQHLTITLRYHKYAPDFLHTFYKEQLEELLPHHGFKIETIEYFDYPNDPWPDEGKGHIGFIATKI